MRINDVLKECKKVLPVRRITIGHEEKIHSGLSKHQNGKYKAEHAFWIHIWNQAGFRISRTFYSIKSYSECLESLRKEFSNAQAKEENSNSET